MYKPKSRNEWVLLTITAAQALLVTALDLYILLTYFDWVTPYVYQVPNSYVVPANFAIVVLGNLYQAVLAWDGLRVKNTLQLYSVYLLNAGLLFFSVMRYRQTKMVTASLQRAEAAGHKPLTNRHINYWKNVEPALLTVTASIGLSWLVQGVLVCLLHREFKWAIYRHIRGSLEMLRRYFTYQVLVVLMRFEIYFFIAFIVLYGLISVHYRQPEFALTMAMIPALTILVILTILFTKSENYLGAIFAIILRLGEITYLLSRILLLTGKSRRANTALKDEMLFFAGTAIALATLACFNAMLCVFNFRKGLRPLLGGYSWNQAPSVFEPVHQHRYSERIELD
ncbi:hypothetical protein IAQ61_000422 [Plenodomus lingam]|uniref:Uncharacterized protein n=1 Tax=Leptosphaeria maculans (strain JN3 / isolate v23.1.3 / race Av1-4-5-6-7-8) TaxID=985895 RepID=E5R4X0_LEPMJ|nr:hypothetical protein LEMA_P049490.1 [Plenodomus lingam JN3]KAH9881695.1 hypothetical protein IAQ61_000422 [Plenodomus lingam]CBX92243.1 hypothetical protein LEMA_P049490.1 [Plenodomus lingam JN3]